jgi:hypothetical protein
VEGIKNFVKAIFFSPLPKELAGNYRPASTVAFLRGAYIGALLELSFCYPLLQNYFHFLQVRADELNSLSHGALRSANEGTQLYFHYILTLEYLIHPLSLVLLYLTIEGALRFLSIFFTGENYPSLILVAGLKVRRAIAASRSARNPSLPDEIRFEPDSEHILKILSCKPKDEWRELMTLEYRDEFFELAEISKSASAERPFGYYFRRKHPGAVIRKFIRFDPGTSHK